MTLPLRRPLPPLRALCLALLVAAAGAAPAAAATGEVVDRSKLRVCADPGNLPYSDEKGEGFENKIAELIAGDTGEPMEDNWFPPTIGFVRQTLAAQQCDLINAVTTTNEQM